MRKIEFAELRGDPIADGETVRLAGRGYSGPIKVGDVFGTAANADEVHQVSLRVDSVRFYGREVAELHPGESAELTLSGTGIERATAGVRLTGQAPS